VANSNRVCTPDFSRWLLADLHYSSNFVGYPCCSEMSKYQNVVGGRLKLKGKALDVKEGGVKKKKKKQECEESSQIGHKLREGLAHNTS
jgi:hypothetical protein